MRGEGKSVRVSRGRVGGDHLLISHLGFVLACLLSALVSLVGGRVLRLGAALGLEPLRITLRSAPEAPTRHAACTCTGRERARTVHGVHVHRIHVALTITWSGSPPMPSDGGAVAGKGIHLCALTHSLTHSLPH